MQFQEFIHPNMQTSEGEFNERCQVSNPCSYCKNVYDTYLGLPIEKKEPTTKQIFINILNHHPIGYDIDLNMETLADLFLFLQEKYGLSPCRQLIISESKILIDPSKNLSEYSQIESSRNIYVQYRHRGYLES